MTFGECVFPGSGQNPVRHPGAERIQDLAALWDSLVGPPRLVTKIERLTSWPAPYDPGEFIIGCSCGRWSAAGTVAEINRASARHDDSPWHNHVVSIRGRLRSAGAPEGEDPGAGQDPERGDEDVSVQHGTDPSDLG